jgi:hypothetical protein
MEQTLPDFTTIPPWFRVLYTAFVLAVVVVWLRHYGWRNFLWLSDVAFIGAVPVMWLESTTLASVLAASALLPELLWNIDLLLRLVLRRRITGLTEYMFEADRPRTLRLLSLFHVPLPLVLLWMLASYGYTPGTGLAGAVLLGAVLLPASRLFGSPQANINWSYGLGRVQSALPGAAYLGLLFAGFAVLVFLPTHLVLQRVFG